MIRSRFKLFIVLEDAAGLEECACFGSGVHPPVHPLGQRPGVHCPAASAVLPGGSGAASALTAPVACPLSQRNADVGCFRRLVWAY